MREDLQGNGQHHRPDQKDAHQMLHEGSVFDSDFKSLIIVALTRPVFL
jgi:CRISPR/Cas system CSM-associated protein Csm4 (group 5 of RAMP superfamily)